jgi:hypothetical protein
MSDDVRADRFCWKEGDLVIIPLQCAWCKYYKGGRNGCTKLVTVPTPVWEKTTACSEFVKDNV